MKQNPILIGSLVNSITANTSPLERALIAGRVAVERMTIDPSPELDKEMDNESFDVDDSNHHSSLPS